MNFIKKEQVGEILQAIYDSEIHLKIEWMWDGGFNYNFGCMDMFQEHPNPIKELFTKIDATKIEQVVTLILLELDPINDLRDTEGELNPIGLLMSKIPN